MNLSSFQILMKKDFQHRSFKVKSINSKHDVNVIFVTKFHNFEGLTITNPIVFNKIPTPSQVFKH